MTVTLLGDFAVYDGYGSMNEYLALGLHRAGAKVSILPLTLDPRGCSREFTDLVARSPARMNGPVLYSSYLLRPEYRCLASTDLFVRTMYESSQVPEDWPPALNRARAVIAPSRFVADVFRSSGVTVPVAVVPDGVDPAVYRYEDRPERAGLTALLVGALQPRKHYREAVSAWQLAFGHDPDARLILKSRMGFHDGFRSDDPRIQVCTDSDASHGIAHWYRQADVLLALGNEGFGLPLIEGMATGLPVIALDSEGQADVCRDAGDLVLAVGPAGWETHLHYGTRQPCGMRAVPGVEEVAAKLRWVAGHRDEARDLGRQASAWVHRHRNVWNYGSEVLAVMEQHTRSRRPIRRHRESGRSHGRRDRGR